jgi:hypothetical protein|tara:strand:- start:627 stop:842 length:216 start_codon:yes stop_codon:yes gene_type:complete
MALGAYISMGDRIGDRVPNNVAVSKETNRSLSPNVGCTAQGKAPPAPSESSHFYSSDLLLTGETYLLLISH